ncbi:MAG: hypothetical protein JRN36_02085 [Nitrososphaerota archaeon]|jgi:hypothetical protein|nr:hypothetical protein [Nitrososphaerota archaeon]
MVEVLVQADLLNEARKAVHVAFGGSPEYRLVCVLTNAQEALPLREIGSRCAAGRRSVLREGRFRLALERLERYGVVTNVGSRERPRYQMNTLDDGAKMLALLIRGERLRPLGDAGP